MKYFLISFLSCLSYFSALFSSATYESEKFPAVFWQREDGKYCVKVISSKDPDDSNNHLFVFDTLKHSEECPCDLNKNLRP